MKRLASVLVLTLAVIGFTACPNKDNQTTTSTNATTVSGQGSDAITTAAVARARQSIGSVADTIVKAADNANHAGKENPQLTSEIKYYESLSAADRVKTVVTDRERLKDIFGEPAWGDPRETLPAPSQTKKTGSVIFEPKEIDPANFDLALKNTDLYAKQALLTNELFRNADPKVTTAIASYQKMNPEQKRAFVMGSNSDFNIYYTYWNYVYLQYQLRMLRQYYIFQNECYWGYQTPGALKSAELSDRAFDLSRRPMNK
jgi:hypothetical protein